MSKPIHRVSILGISGQSPDEISHKHMKKIGCSQTLKGDWGQPILMVKGAVQ